MDEQERQKWRDALLDRMYYLSQEYWDAGWIDGLTDRLKTFLKNGNRHPNGHRALVDYDLESLRELHAKAGGWWVWDDSMLIGSGPGGDPVRFVPDEPKQARGFANLTPERRAEISSLGGKAAHAKGTAHKWDVEAAREAGRKGGKAVHRK